jgi:hypothetical protein
MIKMIIKSCASAYGNSMSSLSQNNQRQNRTLSQHQSINKQQTHLSPRKEGVLHELAGLDDYTVSGHGCNVEINELGCGCGCGRGARCFLLYWRQGFSFCLAGGGPYQ